MTLLWKKNVAKNLNDHYTKNVCSNVLSMAQLLAKQQLMKPSLIMELVEKSFKSAKITTDSLRNKRKRTWNC